jgi:putative membrane protein
MEKQKSIKVKLPVLLIVLFHAVGLVGLMIGETRPLFLQIVPYHLLLMFGVIVYSHTRYNEKLLLFVLLTYLIGYLAEWLGVHTQLLFGHYNYGGTLGVKVLDIPLTIGINWFLLIYSAGVLMQRFRLKSMWLRIIIGALLLVLLDVLIEPVAIRFDYWQWVGGNIPLKNYLCWFGVSSVMLYIFEKFRFEKQSIAGPILLITQCVFFAILQLASY